MSVNRILFASPEVHPVIKTGGLADVSGSLPVALKNLRRELRVIMPAYREAMKNCRKAETVATLDVPGVPEPIQILQSRLPGTSVTLWLVDAPSLFDRPGNPYLGPDGRDWPDNASRFTAFARVIASIAMNRAGLDWQPDLVHCNDWQTGLVPALLSLETTPPATVFTIHNLAYQGLFSRSMFEALRLPEALWSADGLEFYGRFSFIKGGIVYADHVNTVSPMYAREICTEEFGYGLQGLLQHIGDRLSGILNGADYQHWNPARDPYLRRNYNAHRMQNKMLNKADLQRSFKLPVDESIPVIGMIGRLVEQKGFDLVLKALPELENESAQFVILGSGERELEDGLREARDRLPDQIGAEIGYDESLAHQIEGGADMFLMPSRFEPCGLNQIYSLRYGTIPIVHGTGGLANTVVDANETTLGKGVATGIIFNEPSVQALTTALHRCLTLYRQPRIWKKIVFRAMQQDFSWRRSARQYLDLYQKAINHVNLTNQV